MTERLTGTRLTCGIVAFLTFAVLWLTPAVGGATGVSVALSLLAVWSVLSGTHRYVWRVLAAVAFIWVVPLILVGGANYLPSTWRSGILLIIVSPIAGMTLQALWYHVWARRDGHEPFTGRDKPARTDALARLADRDAWDFELEHDLARAQRTGEPVTIVLIDIGSFETVDEVVGCPSADLVMSRIAQNWIEALRPADVLARVGGDEFAVLLPGCSHADAGGVVARLRARMPWPHSCSIGLATWDTLELADEFVNRADNALDDAKRHRRHPATDRAGSVASPSSATEIVGH